MEFKGFVGHSYRTQSTRLGLEETINLNLEINKREKKMQMYRAPGLQVAYAAAQVAPVTGMLRVFAKLEEDPALRNDRLFALIGTSMYEFELDISGLAPALILHGTPLSGIVTDGRPATMTSDPADTQLVFVSANHAYKIESAALTEIQWFGVPVTQVALINNYFLFLSSRGDGFFYSEPGDAGTGDPLNFRSVESDNSNYQALIVDRNADIWVFGTKSTQVFYNDTNDPNEPFKPNQSAFISSGIAGPDLAVAFANRVWWIDEGYEVKTSQGYIGQSVSTHPIENELRKYGDISDGWAWTAQWNGHEVIRWTFPDVLVELGDNKRSIGMTWQYDTSTQDWTRVLSWDPIAGVYRAHRGMSSCEPIKGRQLVGDRENGLLYVMSPDIQTDACIRVPWLRRAPLLETELLNQSFPYFGLAMETGVGTPSGQTADPRCWDVTIPTGGIVAAEFEAVLDNASGDEEGFADLRDTHGNIYATVSIGTRTTYKRVSSVFPVSSLLDTADYFVRLRTPSDPGEAFNVSLYEARIKLDVVLTNGFKTTIWIELANAPIFTDLFDVDFTSTQKRVTLADYTNGNCRFPIEMATGDFGSTGGYATGALDDVWNWFDEVKTETYGPPSSEGDEDGQGLTIYLKEESHFSTLDSWDFEVCAAAFTSTPGDQPTQDGSQIGYAALFNKTTGLMVAGSELTFTEIVPTAKRVTLPNTAVNFTDGNEFWVQFKTTDAAYSFWLYNVTLTPKTINTSKGRSYLRMGNFLGGHGAGTSSIDSQQIYNTTVRSLYESGKFTAGSTFTVETSALVTEGTTTTVNLYDVGDADSGAQVVTKDCTTSSIVTGAWDNIANLPVGINPPCAVTLSVSDETAIVEAGTFGFDGQIPTGVTINSVQLTLNKGILGQASSFTVYARLGGSDENLHTQAFAESTVIGANPDAPPDFIVVMGEFSFNVFTDRTWVIADFADANFVVRVRANQPSNTTATTYYVGGGGITGVSVQVGYGDDVADSDVTPAAATQTRLASDPVTLVDGTRYVMHFTSDSDNNILHGNSFLVADVETSASGGTIPDQPPFDDTTEEFDPMIYLKYSKDWGNSYSNELYRSIGKAGEYSKRVEWWRLATARQWVVQIGGSAGVPIAIDSAYLGDPEVLKTRVKK